MNRSLIIGKVQITPKVVQIEYLNNNQEIIIIDVPTTEK
jgi:hypothetical protein